MTTIGIYRIPLVICLVPVNVPALHKLDKPHQEHRSKMNIDHEAQSSLSQLIAYVLEHQNGLIKGLTYEDLAFRIGRLNKHGKGHAHGMGHVLGTMGNLLRGLERDWGEPIPHIQSLATNKAGPNRGLPDDGIKEFWPEYPHLSRPEKENRVRTEYKWILAFAHRWDEVLKQLNIPSATTSVERRWFGNGGESPGHKALKHYVRNHPEIVGASAEWLAVEEYPLPSFDQIDVFFRSPDGCVAVEVKSAICDAFPDEYERGIYQTIKYRALLEAMARDRRYATPSNVRVVLLLESELPSQYRTTAETLRVEVVQNVKVDE